MTINSDDPAYFGGYIGDNYRRTAEALDLTAKELVTCAVNAVHASFMSPTQKLSLTSAIELEAQQA